MPTVAPGREPPAVLLYTRHTRGTIEAERARRLKTHAGAALRFVGPAAKPHPRIAAANAAQARLATQALADENRWIDEGGHFDPELVGRLRTRRAATDLRDSTISTAGIEG